MKKESKIKEYVASVLGISIFLFCSIILLINVKNNMELLFNHSEINVKIISKEVYHLHKSTYCELVFEYNTNDLLYEGKTNFKYGIFKRIDNLVFDKYDIGSELVLLYNSENNFFVKREFKGEMIKNILFLIISMALVVLFINMLFVGNNNKEEIYIQNRKYKIKKVKRDDIEKFVYYLNQIKHNEIICFGITKNGKTYEYSYENGIYYERIITEKEDNINELTNEELDKVSKRFDRYIKNV